MQYYTPVQSGGQAHPGNPFSESQPSCRPPQIIGEGDVASFVLPDGSIQLYFVPSPAARCPPGALYPPYVNHHHSPWTNYPEAWFIRSVPDQLLAYPNLSRPQCQPENSNPSFLQSRYQSRTGYQLKFHNDGCTSTTDIHYFDASLPQRGWSPRQNMATQAASLPPTPPSESTRPVGGHPCRCDKPCHCFNSYGRADQVHNIFVGTSYENEKNKIRPIPYSECKSIDRSPSVEVLLDKKQKKNTRFEGRNSKSERGCDSESLEKWNKATATFTEQATGSCGAERETQTACGAGVALRRAGSFLRAAEAGAAPERWYPASPAARRALASASDTSSRGGSGSDA